VDYACTAVGLRLTYCSSMPCTVGTTNRRTSGGKLALQACEGLGYIGPGIFAPVAELAHESKNRAPPFPFWYLNLLRLGIQTSPGHSKCKYSHLRPAPVDAPNRPSTPRRRADPQVTRENVGATPPPAAHASYATHCGRPCVGAASPHHTRPPPAPPAHPRRAAAVTPR
jgi:hypothetical protein